VYLDCSAFIRQRSGRHLTNSVVSAALNATRSIPVVFTWVSDPVRSGFVPNLPHPGRKITGFHNFEAAIGDKWLGYLTQIAPGLRRIAVLHVPEIAPNVAFLLPRTRRSQLRKIVAELEQKLNASLSERDQVLTQQSAAADVLKAISSTFDPKSR
jgi:ABC-type uncharacterized transport system substrate-binding protein